MNIFETEWNCVFNVGVKCNALDVTKRSGVRYFSSPWDNMDSVKDIVGVAKLTANKFEGYMDNIDDWGVVETRTQRQIRHKNAPWLYYPHLEYEWVSDYISREEFEDWKTRKKGLDLCWSGFSETYIRRQKRFTSILESKNNVLLLRVDIDKRQIHKIRKNGTTKNLNRFMEILTDAYPNKNWGMLYFYYGEDRNLSCEYDNCHLECIPPDKSEGRSKWIVERLKNLKLLSRDKMKPYDFKEK